MIPKLTTTALWLSMIWASIAAGIATEYIALGTSQQRFKRLLDCKFSARQLIGLTRDQLRDKCGPWNEANVTVGTTGEREQLVYIDYATGPLMYVYVEGGKITTVQAW